MKIQKNFKGKVLVKKGLEDELIMTIIIYV